MQSSPTPSGGDSNVSVSSLLDTRICPRCGSTEPGAHRYCSSCGNPLIEHTNGDSAESRRRIGGTVWAPEAVGIPAGKPMATLDIAPDPSFSPNGRKKRRKRRWYRRPLLVIPMLAVIAIAAVAGAAAYRAQSTLNTIHEVSQPPAMISDSTQSDDPANAAPAGLQFDTAPALAAIEAAGLAPDVSEGGLLGPFKETAGDVSDLAEGAAVAAGVKDPATEAITILIMGVDARPGSQIDIGVRPDALMVLRLDPSNGTCRGLAVPRDTLAELPGYGNTKVNHALMVGGIRYQQLVIERLLGIPIDHYALIDFAGFQALVDAVGGVPVTVPGAIERDGQVLFAEGPQTFDGEQALSYARYRGGADLDIGRIRRQQQIIRGLISISEGRSVAGDVNELLPAVSDHVRTDLQPADLIAIADRYRTDCGDGELQLDSLQGTFTTIEEIDPLFQQPLSYQVVQQATIDEKVRDLAAP